MIPRIKSFLYGLTLPLRAFTLIFRHRSLILLSILPVTITLTLYFYLISFMQDWSRARLLELIAAWGWDPQGVAAWLMLILTKILVVLAGVLTFSVAASIVASPFNDFLAEKAEPYTTPPLMPVPDQGWGLKAKLIGIDLLKTVAAGVASIVALLFSWIPVVNIVAFVVAFLLVTFQYISYAQTRRGEGLRDGFGFLGRHAWACAGFGAAVSFLFAIPIVSALSLPLAVVGGTLLVARARGDQKLLR